MDEEGHMLDQQVILDRYRIVSRAGKGGNATVLRAYDNLLKRDVAIKCIRLSEDDIQRAKKAMEEAAHTGGILPQLPNLENSGGMPSDPAFLDKRDKRRAEKNRTPSLSKQISSSTRPSAASSTSVLGGSLPGKIAGAGTAQIDSVGGTDIELDVSELVPLQERSLDDYQLDVLDDSAATVLPATSSKNNNRLSSLFKHASSKTAEDDPAKPSSLDTSFYDNIPGLEEARAAAHLNDANIVTVYDCVVDGNNVYVIMEYVEGKTLSKIMTELGNGITLDMIATIFNSVSHALEVAHAANMLHLDIKPENVIINKNGQVKVTDFGLATLMDSSGHGKTGGGTIGYMPLEQMQQRALDVRTDEWALASLTYELLSGENPFRAKTLRTAQTAIQNAELVLPSQCWAEIDPSVDDTIFRALDPNPEQRYSSVKDFSKALKPILGDASAGKKQLAKAVEGKKDAEEHTEQEPREILPPLVDRIGVRGASIIMRILAVAACIMVATVSLINCRIDVSDQFGLLSSFPVAFWVALAVVAGLTAWRPRFGMPLAFALFSAMLLFNHAWVLGIVLIVVTGAWWWFFGRHNDSMCTVVLMQPLFGSFGFAAIAPIAAGVALSIRNALLSTGFALVSAAAFASLGSGALATWDLPANAITAANADIAGSFLTHIELITLTDPNTWCTTISWIAAAAVYSLFCYKGTKTFDVIGACIAAALIICGSIADVLIFNTALLLPSLIGGIVAGLIGIVLALLGLPDRIRCEAWQPKTD